MYPGFVFPMRIKQTAVEYRYGVQIQKGKYMSYCTLNSIVGLDVVVVVPIVSSRLLLPAMDVSIRDLKPCTAGAIF